MDTDAIWAAIDGERCSLVELLRGLSDEEWSTPSLCERWTVREVAAHLALSHLGAGRQLVEAVRSGFRFNRLVERTARRHASAPPPRLVGEIEAMIGSRRHVLGTTIRDPLVDVLVHGQDIAVPLGRPRAMPVEAATEAADYVWAKGFPFQARRRLRGLRLEATDADWARGDGAIVRGPLEVLLLLMTGRRARLDELAARPAELFPPRAVSFRPRG
jgi:uncharacterized protein (TIGR03083 family)